MGERAEAAAVSLNFPGRTSSRSNGLELPGATGNVRDKPGSQVLLWTSAGDGSNPGRQGGLCASRLCQKRQREEQRL